MRYEAEPVSVGPGWAVGFTDWVDGEPVKVGLRFDVDSLDELPPVHQANPVLLPDGEGAVAPFDHVSMDWSPDGHEPNGVWDVPHFDLHFFVIDPVQRTQILVDEGMENHPDPEHVPPGYVTFPDSGEPGEGNHWVNPATPEFSGDAFTHALVYGFYDASLVFLEPMVALDFLESRVGTHTEVPWPDAWQEPGWYPHSYHVQWLTDDEVWEVSLEDLEWTGQ